MEDKLHSLGFLLNRASVALGKALNNKLQESNIDLPHSQFVVLRCLYYRNGLSQLEISNLLFKDAAAIKRTIDNLEKKGYVERQQIHSQKNNILITKLGKTVLPEALKIAKQITDKALESLSTKDEKNLFSALNTIFENANKTSTIF